ncbi:hypothetical protein AB0N06_38550 [Streptomyces sp. NPDC051020]|uniref:hypothetical protein n=1 Tax=Streptomyces sp. NPDC051020 TaxID=3155409 RepID=UPI00343A2139
MSRHAPNGSMGANGMPRRLAGCFLDAQSAEADDDGEEPGALLAQPPMVGPEAVENMQGFNEHPVLVLQRYPDAVVMQPTLSDLLSSVVSTKKRVVVGKPLAGLLSVTERFE